MTAFAGREGAVFCNASGSSTLVGEVTGWEYTEDAERLEVLALQDLAKRFVGGLIEAGGVVNMNYDDGDTEQAAMDINDAVAMILRPRGTAVGKPELTAIGNGGGDVVTILNISYAGEANGIVTYTVSFGGRLIKATQ